MAVMQEESAYIFEKKMECPICFKEFSAKQVKTGKARFIGTDDDLRPIHSGVDTVKYDVLFCPLCGYAAVSREFTNITSRQRKNILEGIANKFVGVENPEGAYSYDDAIYRYKMAILTAMVKPSKLSEGAYLALKLSWLYRGALEELKEQEEPNSKYLRAYSMGEAYYKKEAYNGFTKAIASEMPPICGMDENTLNYLMSVLAYQCEDFDNSQRFAYAVLGSLGASEKIKNKVRELVEKLKEFKNEK